MAASDDREARAIVVGTGRVGTALVRSLPQRGVRLQAVISRTPTEARLPEGVPVLESIRDAEVDAGLLILAVPDDHLKDVVARLAAEGAGRRVACAIHTSGTHTSALLNPLREQGAEALSFHPVVVFPPVGSREDPFEGAGVTLEGTVAGVEIGIRLAERLGCLAIPATSDQKKAIHVAASIAANFTTTLVGRAESLIMSSGLSEADASHLIVPLIRSVVRSLAADSPESALTGPIVRGDAGVVCEHLAQLSKLAPDLVPLYRIVGQATLRLAVQSGRISADAAETVRGALE